MKQWLLQNILDEDREHQIVKALNSAYGQSMLNKHMTSYIRQQLLQQSISRKILTITPIL